VSDFGSISGWTREKLECLEKYLDFYQTALKHQSFATVYIDAFAGSGGTHGRAGGGEPGEFLEGAALRALRVAPPFRQYVFIERDPERLEQLRRLARGDVDRVSAAGSRVAFVCGDANEVLPRIVPRFPKASWRGVIFLDPYGMQVEWRTLEAIAAKPIFDVWYLFPMGATVRLLASNSPPEGPNAERLDLVLGGPEWRSLYRPSRQQALFEEMERQERAHYTEIERFVLRRLRDLFPYVHEKTLLLRNSRGALMFSLLFACSNTSENAHRLAKRAVLYLLG